MPPHPRRQAKEGRAAGDHPHHRGRRMHPTAAPRGCPLTRVCMRRHDHAGSSQCCQSCCQCRCHHYRSPHHQSQPQRSPPAPVPCTTCAARSPRHPATPLSRRQSPSGLPTPLHTRVLAPTPAPCPLAPVPASSPRNHTRRQEVGWLPRSNHHHQQKTPVFRPLQQLP